MNVLSKQVKLEFAERPEIPISEPEISVLLPAYNEAKTISNVVKSYYEEICERLPAELIVVEDGSTDGTREILSSLRNEFPVVVNSDPSRKGYAKGVSDALRKCNRDWVFFSDSDGQYSPSDFWNLWECRRSYDMIIGRKVHRREGMHRIILAKGFHQIVNGSFGLNLHDADCGFRLIRREVIKSVIDDVKFLKYSFWAEFTIRACMKGFKIREVPINHSNRTFGNSQIYKPSKIPTIVLKQFMGLLHLYADVKKGCQI
jgi:glycosyltransferase involved in cell wall biosynthesis